MRVSKVAARKARLLLLQSIQPASPVPEEDNDPRPEILCFRRQTLALVQHFFELSSQVGRLPSLLGREFFRARVSHHAVPSFEDLAIFVCDVEICLARLSKEHAEIIAVVGLYRFSQAEAAEILHRSRAAIRLSFSEALDSLAEIFLQAQLLSEDHADRQQKQMDRRSLPPDIAALGKKPPQSVKLAYHSSSMTGSGSLAFRHRP